MTEVEIKKKPPKVEIKEKPKPDSSFDLKKTLIRIAEATPQGTGFRAGLTLGQLAKTFLGQKSGGSVKKGLYANIHAKRKRGGKMRKKGAKGAPTAANFRRAAQTVRKR